MKRYFAYSGIILLLLLSIFSVSCKYDLISEPTINNSGIKNPADYPDYITPPQNVVVSQGDKQKITIFWDPLPNAVNYFIYSAETPFDEFIKIGEKTDNFFIDDKVSFGTTKYYAVSAINYYGTESFLSNKIYGSTLGKPFITSIEPDDNGTSVTVNWWMDNCTEDTYQNDINFRIYAYLDTNRTIIPNYEPIILNADKTSVTIENLVSKTDYYFIVEAFNKENPTISELSDLTCQSTAHQIKPSAPLDFTATQGINKTSIFVSWELPMWVDYYNSQSFSYEEHPLYFVLSRKLITDDDSKYEIIAKYIGSDSTKTAADEYFFDCSSPENSNPLISIKPTESEEFKNNSYSAYLPTSVLTFEDTTAERGKQYIYSIQSFTDYSKKLYTSDNKTTEGWKISIPEFKVYSTVEKDPIDIEKINNVKISYELDFDDFDKKYTYTIVSTRKSLSLPEVTDNPKVIKSFNEMVDLNNFINEVNPAIEENQGYYTFQLFILESTESDITEIPTSFYENINAIGSITVTDDAKLIPKIKNFTVLDGYKDKFILSWDKSEIKDDCIYTVNWTPYINGEQTTEESYIISSEELTINGDIVTYEHEAISGDCRKYSITANTGLSSTEALDTIFKTLGTPKPEMSSINYDKIIVTWPSVQKSDNEKYSVSAKYTDDPTELAINDDDRNISTTIKEIDGLITCIINNPAGYSDAKISGKQINFTVTAQSENTSDSTTSDTIAVRTLGPALLDVKKAYKTYQNCLEITWKKDSDAKGYIINRVLYKNNEITTGTIASTYYFDSETGVILDAGGQSVDGRIQIKLNKANNTYTLTDLQKDIDEGETGGYQYAQERIQWGLPFGYIVLPVNDTRFFDDSKYETHFKFETDSQLLETSSSIVLYSHLRELEVITATNGYGLNVKATKAESANTVTVEWDEPYVKDLQPNIYRRKFIYDKFNDVLSTENSPWEIAVSNIAAGTTSYPIEVLNSDWGNAYEYAVQYTTGNADFVNSYQNDLASESKKETRYTYLDNEKWEPANKGYVLALEDFFAEYGGNGTSPTNPAYYQENITWKDWDYNVRYLGPDSFAFGIKNKNLSSTSNWLNILEYDGSTYSVTNTDEETSVSKVQNDNIINIKPIWKTQTINGNTETLQTTNGYLKVLRDAKHYYSVTLKRSDEKAGIFNGNQAKDESIFAYRQITDEELAKITMLNFAYAFYLNDGGTENLSNINKQFTYGGEGIQTGISGKATFSDRSRATTELGWGKYKQYYSFNEYGANFYTPNGTYVSSPLKISCDRHSAGIKGDADNFIYLFRDAHDISVTTCDPLVKLDYSAIIHFECSGTKNLSLKISRNGTDKKILIETNNTNTRKRWFPMEIHEDKYYLFKPSENETTDYGWWD